MDADRLEQARLIDERYHLAKLVAAAIHKPDLVWEEHEQVRHALLAPPTTPPSGLPSMEQIARIHRRLIEVGLRQPDSGAVN